MADLDKIFVGEDLYKEVNEVTESGTVKGVAKVLTEIRDKIEPSVIANPTLTGTEPDLTGLQVGSNKYKVNTSISGAMTYKGDVLQANLPTSGQKNGDYYRLIDAKPSEYHGQSAIWNGTSWTYSDSNITVDDSLSGTSVNPVQNKKIYEALLEKVNLLGNEVGSGQPYNFPYHISDLSYDSTSHKIKGTLHTITLDNNKTIKTFPLEVEIPDVSGFATKTYVDEHDEGLQQNITNEANARSVADLALGVDIDKKIDLLGNEAGSGEPYHFTYYYDIKPFNDKYEITIDTITLDNNKTLKKYNFTLPSASSTAAGLLSTTDKAILDKAVTTDGNQSIGGNKTFTSPLVAPHYIATGTGSDGFVVRSLSYLTKYKSNVITRSVDGGTTNYDIILPNSAGTLALLSDIPTNHVVKEIDSANGKARIFNEADGGGAKFEHIDNTNSFIGVNDGGSTGIAGQLYVINKNDAAEGCKINLEKGMFTYIKNKPTSERSANDEIAVKNDINSVQELVEDEAENRELADQALDTRINNLQGIGRFLSTINCNAQLVATMPTTLPYSYRTGDYFIVTTGGGWKPKNGVASIPAGATNIEWEVTSQTTQPGDTWRYDGTNWLYEPDYTVATQFSQIGGQPTDNTNLASALNAKQNVIDSTHKLDYSLIDNTPDLSVYRTSSAQDTIDAGKQAIIGGGSANNIVAYSGTAGTVNSLTRVQSISSSNTDLEIPTAKAAYTSLSGKQATITGGASSITTSNLTVDRALVSNSSGKVAVSDITTTELGYLDGVTSNIQTQLNDKGTKVTSISGTSTDAEYPSAKAVYDYIASLDADGTSY